MVALASLFEPRPRRARPTTLEAELDAVQRGDKAIAFFASEREVLEDGSDLVPVLRAAFDRELAVTLAPRGDVVDVFVARPEQGWRIPAFQTLAAQRPWSFAAEAHQAVLLGYTPEDRTRWLAEVANERAAFGHRTVYTLLDAAQLARTRSVGFRALAPEDELVGRELFFARDLRVPKRAPRLPKGTVLARFGLADAAITRLFGAPRTWSTIAQATLTRRTAPVVTSALGSSIQILDARGWSV